MNISEVYCVVAFPESLVVSIEEGDGESLNFRIRARDSESGHKVDYLSGSYKDRVETLRHLAVELEGALGRFEKAVKVEKQKLTLEMIQEIKKFLRKNNRVTYEDFSKTKAAA